MLLSVARHRRFYENICIFFLLDYLILSFLHVFLYKLGFFFLFFDTIANQREKILD